MKQGWSSRAEWRRLFARITVLFYKSNEFTSSQHGCSLEIQRNETDTNVSLQISGATCRKEGLRNLKEWYDWLWSIRYARYQDDLTVPEPDCKNSNDINSRTTVWFGPYEWLVLDQIEGHSLLITRDVIACLPFANSKKDSTWGKSLLRKWLNKEFLQSFLPEEEAIIEEAPVQNGLSDSNTEEDSTWDRVFLLSIEEVNNLFKTDIDRICTPNRIAEKEGVYNWSYINNACWWWLRDQNYDGSVPCVSHDGLIIKRGVNASFPGVGVRPAIWIRTSELKKLSYG